MTDFLKSSKTKAILWIVSGIVILLLVFGFGIAVGYRRALFASEFGENYYHNFSGGMRGGMMPPGGPPIALHGVAGEVIDIESSTISVRDSMGNEDSVAVLATTPIREMDNYITINDVDAGEGIIAIGEPNSIGRVRRDSSGYSKRRRRCRIENAPIINLIKF